MHYGVLCVVVVFNMKNCTKFPYVMSAYSSSDYC